MEMEKHLNRVEPSWFSRYHWNHLGCSRCSLSPCYSPSPQAPSAGTATFITTTLCCSLPTTTNTHTHAHCFLLTISIVTGLYPLGHSDNQLTVVLTTHCKLASPTHTITKGNDQLGIVTTGIMWKK